MRYRISIQVATDLIYGLGMIVQPATTSDESASRVVCSY
jgi:hypothetical protein